MLDTASEGKIMINEKNGFRFDSKSLFVEVGGCAGSGMRIGAGAWYGSCPTSAIYVDVGQSYLWEHAFNTNGSIKAHGGFFESSDERLKDFKQTVDINLDSLSQLSKKYFR